jgi:putative acetyltransferase
MAEILAPDGIEQLEQVRRLMRAFVAWHRRRHQEDLALIDAYFDAAAFESELASLPGKYAPPDGRLLLATHDGRPAGCVALRRIDHEACEMKRMFVDEALQGQGVGRALGHAIIDEARAAGYRTMYLDTSIRQREAQTLYRRLGFRDIEPYYDLPPELRHWLVFMKLSLAPQP